MFYVLISQSTTVEMTVAPFNPVSRISGHRVCRVLCQEI